MPRGTPCVYRYTRNQGVEDAALYMALGWFTEIASREIHTKAPGDRLDHPLFPLTLHFFDTLNV